MKQFSLCHLVLYAKGWYKQTDDIWADLVKILKLDGYTPFTKMDAYNIIVSCFDGAEFGGKCNDLPTVLNGIHPLNCWKVGYYTKGTDWFNGTEEEVNNLPKYDMPTAFIYYLISNLRFMEGKYYKFTVPNYKLHPRNPEIPLKNVIERFNRKQLLPVVRHGDTTTG